MKLETYSCRLPLKLKRALILPDTVTHPHTQFHPQLLFPLTLILTLELTLILDLILIRTHAPRTNAIKADRMPRRTSH